MSLRRNLGFALLFIGAAILLLASTYVLPLFLQPAVNTPAVPKTPEPESDSADHPPDMVIQPFKRTVTLGGKNELEINAERAEIIQGKADYFILKKIQRAVFYGRDGLQYFISADEGLWDEAKKKATLKGAITCSIEHPEKPKMEIHCDEMTYDWMIRVLKGSGNVKIDHGPYHAEADGIAINLAENFLVVDGRVSTLIEPAGLAQTSMPAIGEPIIIKSRRARYNHKTRLLEYIGDPSITQGNNSIRCGVISFTLGDDPIFIGRLGVTIELQIPATGDGPPTPLTITGQRIKASFKSGDILIWGDAQIKQSASSFSAEEIRLQMDQSAHQLLGGSASGLVVYRSGDISATAQDAVFSQEEEQIMLSGNAEILQGTENQIRSQIIRIYPSRKLYAADVDVKIRYMVPASQKSQSLPKAGGQFSIMPSLRPGSLVTVVCDRAELDDSEGAVKFVGNVQGKQADYTFGAGEVSFRYDSLTREFVHMRADTRVSVSQMDQVLTADHLHYDGISSITEARGNVVLWQGRNKIQADELTYKNSEGIAYLNGNVDVLLEVKEGLRSASKDGKAGAQPPDMIHLTADKGEYHDREGKSSFHDRVVVEWDTWTIRSDELEVEMDLTTRQVRTAQANKHVEVHQALWNAMGDSLTYSLEQSIIILRGSDNEKCRVWSGERGTEAETITFDVKEGKYTIEQGVSVIMSDELTKTAK